MSDSIVCGTRRGIGLTVYFVFRITPPFQPVVNHIRDTANFDAEFTNMPLELVRIAVYHFPT